MTPSTLSAKSFKEIGKAIPLLSLLITVCIDEFVLDVFPFALTYSCLFYWSIYQPEHLPFSGLFGVALVADGLAGDPFGRTFLLFLLTLLMGQSQQRSLAQASFNMIWAAFAFYMIFFMVARYMLDGTLYGQFEPYPHIIQSYLGTVAVHPMVFYTLIKVKGLLETP